MAPVWFSQYRLPPPGAARLSLGIPLQIRDDPKLLGRLKEEPSPLQDSLIERPDMAVVATHSRLPAVTSGLSTLVGPAGVRGAVRGAVGGLGSIGMPGNACPLRPKNAAVADPDFEDWHVQGRWSVRGEPLHWQGLLAGGIRLETRVQFDTSHLQVQDTELTENRALGCFTWRG